MAFFSIYKPNQGYWTRTLSAIGAATIVLTGVAWIWAQLERLSDPIYYQAGMAVGVIVFFSVLVFWLLNTPKIADFMIATEAEMKKVNWPTRREVIGSTTVVIAGTFMIALLLFFINLFFGWFFLWIKILQAAKA